MMLKTCSNCLNAYNSPHDRHVHCVNREWMQQFQHSLRTVVARDETCSTWQRRSESQQPLVFSQPVQTELFETTRSATQGDACYRKDVRI